MRLRRAALAVSTVVFAVGCTRSEAPPAAAAPDVDIDLLVINDVMAWIVEPAADVVFAAAGRHAPPDRRPAGAPAWQAVADAAERLAEQGRLLMHPAIASKRADWQGLAAAMFRGASEAMEAARRHDAERAAQASDALRAACQGCHLRYAPALVPRLGDVPR